MSNQSWSPRTNTPVIWATESVTTSLSLQTSLWRWEQVHYIHCWAHVTLLKHFFKNFLSRLPSDEELLWHTTGSHISCGGMERRPERRADLHSPRGLLVFYVGLGWPLQGSLTDLLGIDATTQDGFELTGLLTRRLDSKVRPTTKPSFGSERTISQRLMKSYR